MPRQGQGNRDAPGIRASVRGLIGRAVHRHAGRSLSILLGSSATITGVVLTADGAASLPCTILIGGGMTMASVGALLPHIKRLKIFGGELEVRGDDAGADQLDREIDQIREVKPDPASTDLVGTDWWDGARYRLGERAIEALLGNLTGTLSMCEARVFLFDAATQRLVPALAPPATSKSRTGWALGEGVTGVAYQEDRYAFATGDACSDGTFGLEEEKQRRYKHLTEVAAVPLADRAGRAIGTLSLSSKSKVSLLTSQDGYREHIALTQQVSVALRELLGYTPEGTIPGNGHTAGDSP